MACTQKHLVGRSILNTSAASIIALATAMTLAPQNARAQSFQGTPTVTAGAATITEGAGTTDVSAETTQVVIDWVPDDTAVGGGNINFQAAGTTASFANDSGIFIGDYAVLNRIVPVDPSRMVELNGNISSIIDDGSVGSLGGNIFFYSPGGILVGGTAVINVGSLVLTASDPLVNAGQFIDAGDSVQFQQATQPGATVMTAAGSSIFTSGSPNFSSPGYLALVAPVVEHAGDSFSNTAAAMVSADAATITFAPDGLFSIQVTSGTSGTGTTLSVIGDLNTELGGYAYLAAVPKNDAITMALTAGSEIGFDVAQNATAVNASTVILGAGTDIIVGGISLTTAAGSGTGTVNVDIGAANVAGLTQIAGTGDLTVTGGADFRGDFNGQVKGAINILADVDDINFASGVALDTGNFSPEPVDNSPDTASDITVIASAGNSISVNGAMTLRTVGGAGLLSIVDPIGKDGTGGDIIFSADGGSISVNGNLQLQSQGVGRQSLAVGGTSGTGTGGSISVSVDAGGSISSTTMGLFSLGGAQTSSNGGDGIGGTVSLQVLNGGTITSGRYALLAQGTGGGANAAGGIAGDGIGGSINVESINGTIVENNSINSSAIAANGLGGDALGTNGFGGDGTGGQVSIVADGATSSISFTALDSTAAGLGGAVFADNGTGGDGQGGTIDVIIRNSANFALTANSASRFDTLGQGGTAANTGGQGGNGTGGTTEFSVLSGATANLTATEFNFVDILAEGVGGFGGMQDGDATGGSASVVVTDASLFFDDILVSAIASSEENGALNATGGTASVLVEDTGGSGATMTGNFLAVETDAFSASPDSGSAGAAFGGQSTLEVTGPNALLSAGNIRVDSEATGGDSFDAGSGGDATGGVSNIFTNLGGTLDINGFINMSASARAGSGAIGGDGIGGDVTLGALADSSINAVRPVLAAAGFGGDSTAIGGTGGDGTGGSVTFTANGGTITQVGGIANTALVASGFGGDAFQNNGIGGMGTGGTVLIGSNVDGAGFSLFGLTAFANGIGGDNGEPETGFADNAVAGDAIGGVVQLSIGNGASFSISNTANVSLQARAFGGDSEGLNGIGGTAVGGSTSLAILDGSSANLTGDPALGAILLSDALGGNGGTDGVGGDATAGSSTLSVRDSDAAFSNLLVSSSATAGDGLFSGDAIGGDAIGGDATVEVNGGTLTFAPGSFLQVLSDGTGGDGETIGGDGLAGISQVNVFASQAGLPATFVVESLLIESSAVGGTGADAGAATGGNASLTAGGNDGLASVGVTDLEIFARANGGVGSDGEGGVGGDGGDAQGGFAALESIAGNGQITVGDATLDTSGTGGNGGDGGFDISGDGFDGGVGGSGFGGIAVARTIDLANAPGTAGFLDLDFLSISSDGLGGLGGAGAASSSLAGIGGDGGDGDSGGAWLTAEGAPIIINQSAILSADGVGGDGGSAIFQQGLGGNGVIGGDNSLFAATDDVRIVTAIGPNNGAAGSIEAGTSAIVATSFAQGGIGTVNGEGLKAGRAYFLSNGGDLIAGSLTFDTIYTNADPGADEEALYFGPNSSASLGALNVTTPGALSYANEGTVDIGNLVLNAPDYVFSTLATPTTFGTTTFDNLTFFAAANIILQSNFVSNVPTFLQFLTPGDVFVGDVSTANDLTISAGGSITTGQLDSAGLLGVQANGAINIAGATATNTQLFINSNSDITVGDISSLVDVIIQSQANVIGGQVDSTGFVQITSGGSTTLTGAMSGANIAIDSSAGVTVSDSLIAGTDLNVIADGQIMIAGLAASGPGSTVFMNAQSGGLNLGSVSSGAFASFVGGGSILIGDLTSVDGFNVIATEANDVANGTVTVAGNWTATGPSAVGGILGLDLVVEPGSAISAQSDLSIISNNVDGVFVGSAADASSVGFGIDQAEFDALSSLSIVIQSRGVNPNDDSTFMEIGDLSITFSDPNAFVGFTPFGQGQNNTLLVSGDLVTTNAGIDTELGFAADDILVEAGDGGIFSLDSAGDPNGFVTIIADRLIIAEQAVLDLLAQDPNLANRVELLNAPTTIPRPDGVFVAGGVGLTNTTQVAIQNTGSVIDPAGFFVVNGFSEFDTTEVEFIINGQLGDGLGGVITGDAVAEIVFTDPDIPLAAGSTVNGCTDVGQCPLRTEAPPQVPRPPFLTPTPTTPPPLLPPNPPEPTDPETTDPEHKVPTGGPNPNDPPDDNEEDQLQDEASEAPIESPAALIDFSDLDPNQDVFAPVSGGANPSLIGTPKPSDEDGEGAAGNAAGEGQ